MVMRAIQSFWLLAGASVWSAWAVAAPPDHFEPVLGGYTGNGDTHLEIFRENRRGSPGPYGLTVTAKDGYCAGTVSGPIIALEHHRYVMYDTERTCRVSVELHGRGATLSESSPCSTFHGSACGFAGKFERDPE